jgi:hypothetical protein
MADDRPANGAQEGSLIALDDKDPRLAKAVVDKFTDAFVTAASLSSTARKRAAEQITFSVDTQHLILHATSADTGSAWEEPWDGKRPAALKFAERVGRECASRIMRERARDGSTHWDG